jgi:hypothetical protein
MEGIETARCGSVASNILTASKLTPDSSRLRKNELYSFGNVYVLETGGSDAHEYLTDRPFSANVANQISIFKPQFARSVRIHAAPIVLLRKFKFVRRDSLRVEGKILKDQVRLCWRKKTWPRSIRVLV